MGLKNDFVDNKKINDYNIKKGVNTNNSVSKDPYIYAKIAELENKKKDYLAARNKALSLVNQIQDASTYSGSIGESLEELVIMGKTFDDGTFGSLSNNLNNMVQTFEEVANECSVKMNSIDAEIAALKNQMEIM